MLLHEWLRVSPAGMTRAFGVLAVLVLSGCDDPVSTVPPRMHPTGEFSLTIDTHSRANLVWQDFVDVGTASAPSVVPAGIRGDGRNKSGELGTPDINEYQGDFCGVRAFIYDQRGENGNLNPDPDTYYTSAMDTRCHGARKMALYLGAPTPFVTGPIFFFDAIWTLGPGAVVVQPMNFGVQDVMTPACRFYFDASYTGASNVRISRLADVPISNTVVARQWRVESQGTHNAACLELQRNGKYVDTGRPRYYLPFAVTITQVPYPYATFP